MEFEQYLCIVYKKWHLKLLSIAVFIWTRFLDEIHQTYRWKQQEGFSVVINSVVKDNLGYAKTHGCFTMS